ncbi:3-dehydroquinate synthase [Legionella oakridgensis]|nr:3-dehydroquinate synthase [Legionella oakridgensis]KTD38090.1 3-dehydroquinate synthase [Legionella oakridgensis]STY19850.1 3-dehydroquinate synthase [Legionella longbeachae]
MAKSDVHRQLMIQLVGHEYPIYIGCHYLSDVELLRRHVKGSQVLIVSNETVAPLYLKPIQQAFATMQCDTVLLKDGEVYKNQQSLNRIYDALIHYGHHRDTTLIALGGGVIGDITGFAAATYQRGVRFIQLPTTLLAQVDASVGGKTAINHPLAKNIIGSFYQPHAVIMDVNTLFTLPERELYSGFAEVIKYGFIAGGEFLQMLCRLLEAGIESLTTEQWSQLIAGCCQIKARIVEEDEHETGQRALLNLGHTFAHALEAYTHYQRWRHGEAVAIGLYCAALLSHHLGHLQHAHVVLLDALLAKANLPRRIPKEIDLLALHRLMFNDKKISNKRLRFVLMRAPGNCYLDDKVTDDCLRHALISAVEGEI